MDQKFIEHCIKNKIVGTDIINVLQKDNSIGTDFYSKLVEIGAVSQEKLAVSAGEFYKTPVVDLSKVKPDAKALACCTPDEYRKWQFVPIALESNGTLHVALVDFSYLDSVKTLIEGKGIEKSKYYIAPVNSLAEMINKVFGKPAVEEASVFRKSRASVRTQKRKDDINNASSQTGSPIMQSNSKLMQELAACREENQELRLQLNRLTAVMELESNLLRSLAKTLVNNGVIDSKTFDRWLESMR